MTFTEELRKEAGDVWERVIHHKFTKELAANTIHRTVLTRYLIQDFRFLDSFVILLSSMVAKCRTLDDRIPGCQFLALITGQENTYFERCFETLGVTEAHRKAIPDAACSTAFCTLMKETAYRGSLAEMLSVLVVCEWSYLSWGQLVAPSTVRDDFVCYEWVDLHSGGHFESVVHYLRTLLDKEGALMDETERKRCKERFLTAVQLEEEFFEFAYESEDS